MLTKEEASELVEQICNTLNTAQTKSSLFVKETTPAVVSFVEKYWWAIGIGALAIGVGTLVSKRRQK